MKAIIVGAGVGGLSTAIALGKLGWQVEVLERAEEPRVVGAGLLVQPNAVPVLDALGVGALATTKGKRITDGALQSANGKILSRMDLSLGGVRPAALGIHRADLQSVLLSALDTNVLRCDAHVVGVTERGVRDAEGEIYEGDVVIIADGIHSAIAESLGAPPLRYAGYTCWRGVCPNDGTEETTLFEVSGKGRRFGIVPISDSKLYWFATLNAPRGGRDDPSSVKKVLGQRFSGFPERVRALVDATPVESILRNDIIDRPPRRTWGRGHLTLLGDAAHPMTPNLGQGASQALVDALCLQRHLTDSTQDTITTCLRAYEAERVGPTSKIVKASWQFGKLGQLESFILRKLRDFALRMTPESVTKKQILELTG